MAKTYLALDGACNGQYIDAATAVLHDYVLSTWTNGETVWVQREMEHELTNTNGDN